MREVREHRPLRDDQFLDSFGLTEFTSEEGAESLIKRTFEFTAGGIAVLDIVGRIVCVNPAFARMLDYSERELVGKSYEEITYEEDRRKSRDSFSRLFTDDPGYQDVIKRYMKKSGSPIWVQLTCCLVRNRDGEVRYVITQVQDVTKLKSFVLAQKDQALLQQSTFFRQVIDINPHFIFAKDRDGRFTLVNQAVADAYGVTVEELTGKTDAHFNPVTAEVEHFRNDDLEVMERRKEKLITEERLTDAHGRVRYLQTVKRPIVDGDGIARQVLGVATDITEQKRSEEERQRLEEQLRNVQRLESLGLLAGGVAHDFNNILTGMIGNLELARKAVGEDSPATARLQQIEIGAKRASDLVKQLLAYAGRGRVDPEPVDITGVFSEMTALLGSVVGQNVKLEFALEGSLPLVRADITQIRQIVMNLIANAADAMDGKTGRVLVSTKVHRGSRELFRDSFIEVAKPGGMFVCVSVEDNGCGMNSETVARIFDPFYTTKVRGRGLGLAAVLGIVRAHGGTIKVTSEVGVGSRFEFFVPIDETVVAPLDHVSSAPEEWRGQGTVLVVDDEPVIRELVRTVFEERGFSVLEAEDGEQGLELFKKRTSEIAFIFLDTEMPVMSGRDMYRELRELPNPIPVLFSSGFTEETALSDLLGERQHFIQKPFPLTALAEKAREILRR